MKFHLVGTRQCVGSIGAHQPFDTYVIAESREDAERVVRDNWRDEWQHVLFTLIRES